MNKYEVVSKVGEGAYGIVLKARNKQSGEFVAIKKFKESEEDEGVKKSTTREVKILRILRSEPHIVHLKEAFRRKGKLYLVFEYIGCNLLEMLDRNQSGLPMELVHRYMWHLVCAVHACHTNNIIHRDIKPENLLIDTESQTLMLCDFGFARTVSQRTGNAQYTDYVATRWYRSPELLLGTTNYDRAVDMWAVGCIFCELLDGKPAFPAATEIDQLFMIQRLLGPLPEYQMELFRSNPRFKNTRFPDIQRSAEHSLESKYFSKCSKKMSALLKGLLQLHPDQRMTSEDAFNHPWFEDFERPAMIPARESKAKEKDEEKHRENRRPSTVTPTLPIPEAPAHAVTTAVVPPAPVVLIQPCPEDGPEGVMQGGGTFIRGIAPSGPRPLSRTAASGQRPPLGLSWGEYQNMGGGGQLINDGREPSGDFEQNSKTINLNIDIGKLLGSQGAFPDTDRGKHSKSNVPPVQKKKEGERKKSTSSPAPNYPLGSPHEPVPQSTSSIHPFGPERTPLPFPTRPRRDGGQKRGVSVMPLEPEDHGRDGAQMRSISVLPVSNPTFKSQPASNNVAGDALTDSDHDEGDIRGHQHHGDFPPAPPAADDSHSDGEPQQYPVPEKVHKKKKKKDRPHGRVLAPVEGFGPSDPTAKLLPKINNLPDNPNIATFMNMNFNLSFNFVTGEANNPRPLARKNFF